MNLHKPILDNNKAKKPQQCVGRMADVGMAGARKIGSDNGN